MSFYNVTINQFNGGEISARAQARTDLNAYSKSLDVTENFLPTAEGQLTKLPGSFYLGQVHLQTARHFLVRFKFSEDDAFCLEFGDQLMRVWELDGDRVLDTPNAITNITAFSATELTFNLGTALTYVVGESVYIENVVGANADFVNNKWHQITTAGVNPRITIDDTTGFVYTSGGTLTKPYSIATPYLQADFFDADGALKFDFEQRADTIYIVHDSYAMREFVRTAADDWAISTSVLIDGPYEAENATAVTMQAGGTALGTQTITASAPTFVANDVGRLLRLGKANVWGYGIIAAFTDTTHVDIDVQITLPGTTAEVSWRIGLYGTDNGFPTAISFVQDRLVLGGIAAREHSDRFDMSRSAGYLDFAPNEAPDSGTSFIVTDATAISRSLTGEINNIRWIKDDRQGMIIGTSGGVWLVSPSNRNEAITAANINAVRTSGIGTSQHTNAVRADDAIVHVQRFRKRMRSVTYSFEKDSMMNDDLSRLADHIGSESPFIKVDYQESPYPTLWGLRADGTLCTVLYSPNENIVGWARHPKVNSFVEDFIILPSTSDNFDQVWMIVKRTINGATARYVERIDDIWEQDDSKDQAVFVDSAIINAGPITTISFLDHLEGEELAVLVDGNVHPLRTVVSGDITLAYEAEDYAVVGLPYTSRADTLELFAEDKKGTTQNYNSKITSVVMRIWESLGGMFGTPDNEKDKIIYRDVDDVMDSSPDLESSKVSLENIGDDYDLDSQVSIEHSDPLPFTISAFYVRLEVSEE